MLYDLTLPTASTLPFIARDSPRLDYGFLDDLREFISLRPDRRNTGGAGNLYAVKPSSEPCSPFLVRDRPGFDHTFIEDLREFISLRLDRVDPYRESKEYCSQQEKASRLYDRLREALPEEGRAALLAYGEALGAAHHLEVAMLAERAFLDGIRIVARTMMNVE